MTKQQVHKTLLEMVKSLDDHENSTKMALSVSNEFGDGLVKYLPWTRIGNLILTQPQPDEQLPTVDSSFGITIDPSLKDQSFAWRIKG